MRARAKTSKPGRRLRYDKMTPMMYLGCTLRRQIASNWFATILRVGNTGFGEVRPVSCATGLRIPPRYKASFKPPRTGDVSSTSMIR